MRSVGLLGLAAFALGACTAGPGSAALTSALEEKLGAAPPIRDIACSFTEESALWFCRIEMQAASGQWAPHQARLGKQGDRWINCRRAAG